MVKLTPLQSVRIFGWSDPRPILTWNDVTRLGLTFEGLIGSGLRTSELVLIQPDPVQWVVHAKVCLSHARDLMLWPANPFAHLGADLGDVLAQNFTADELLRMDVTHGQLVRYGLTARTEKMFKFSDAEWEQLGKPDLLKSSMQK
jgi:hypothetical protein